MEMFQNCSAFAVHTGYVLTSNSWPCFHIQQTWVCFLNKHMPRFKRSQLTYDVTEEQGGEKPLEGFLIHNFWRRKGRSRARSTVWTRRYCLLVEERAADGETIRFQAITKLHSTASIWLLSYGVVSLILRKDSSRPVNLLFSFQKEMKLTARKYVTVT